MKIDVGAGSSEPAYSFPPLKKFSSMSLHLVYVCVLVRISVVNVLGFESRFSLRYCGQFYFCFYFLF